jgi:glycosyltransferase involved in cell wall biosynthesis
MSHPLRIAVLGDFFTQWMGGAAFLRNILEGLWESQDAANARVHLFLSSTQLRAPGLRANPGFTAINSDRLDTKGVSAVLLQGLTPSQEIIFYHDLSAAVSGFPIDIIGLSGESLGPDFAVPWCGYIYDFQHQYLGHLFTQQERIRRDAAFRRVAEDSSAIFVNSSSVASDVERFYPSVASQKPIIRFPMVLRDLRAVACDGSAAPAGIDSSSRYVISCAQRWVHKQHDLIIRGFAMHKRERPESDLLLVFTGAMSDDRNPAYAGFVHDLAVELGVADSIRYTGLVPKAQQVSLIKSAEALIQASLFEGGPGASGSLEAALLGTPILASDIPPNRELPIGNCQFFDRHSFSELGTLINKLASNPAPPRESLSGDACRALTERGCVQMIETLRGIAKISAAGDLGA